MLKKVADKTSGRKVLKYGAIYCSGAMAPYMMYRAANHVVKSSGSKKKDYFEDADMESINIANGFNEDIFVRVDTAIINVCKVLCIYVLMHMSFVC